MKKSSLPASLKKNPTLLHELETFLDFVPPGRLSKNLRRMFMLYLSEHQHEGIDPDMNEQVMDLYFLFELLDAAEEAVGKN